MKTILGRETTSKDLFVLYGLITIVYICLVFIAAIIPKLGNINIFPSNNLVYFLHFIEFGILSYLLFKLSYYFSSKNPYLSAFCIAIIIAVLSEAVQLFIPYRAFNPLDIASEGAGAFFALFITGKIK